MEPDQPQLALAPEGEHAEPIEVTAPANPIAALTATLDELGTRVASLVADNAELRARLLLADTKIDPAAVEAAVGKARSMIDSLSAAVSP